MEANLKITCRQVKKKTLYAGCDSVFMLERTRKKNIYIVFRLTKRNFQHRMY